MYTFKIADLHSSQCNALHYRPIRVHLDQSYLKLRTSGTELNCPIWEIHLRTVVLFFCLYRTCNLEGVWRPKEIAKVLLLQPKLPEPQGNCALRRQIEIQPGTPFASMCPFEASIL